MDDNGHGTHVVGTIAAEDNDVVVIGVAPEADLYALKVLGASGSGSFSAVIAALNWCVSGPDGIDGNADDPKIQVTNNSYGNVGNPGTLVQQAFDNAYCNHGIINVCAAGNEYAGTDTVIYPAKYESCIAVAATDSTNTRASFSSTGPTVELAAPGLSIYSTYKSGGYAYMSGTSMACPHVAGTAALVIASDFIGDVRARLQQTADDLGVTGRDTWYGYDLVDADEAAAGGVPVDSPPIVAVIAPLNGATVNGTVNIVAHAEDDKSITQVEFFVDGVSIGAGTNGPDGWSVAWDTTAHPDGLHTVTATATDTIGQTESDSNGITVQNSEPTVYVASISMRTSTRRVQKDKFTKAVATVLVTNASGVPVSGATVHGFWNHATGYIDSGVTNSSGQVALSSDEVRNAPRGTRFTFTVDGVDKFGWEYDPASNAETSDSITY